MRMSRIAIRAMMVVLAAAACAVTCVIAYPFIREPEVDIKEIGHGQTIITSKVTVVWVSSSLVVLAVALWAGLITLVAARRWWK